MSHDFDAALLSKLTLSVCLKAAKLGMPENLDPKILLAWIKNPDELERKMVGILDFLRTPPETVSGLDVSEIETTTIRVCPMRNAVAYLGCLRNACVVTDPVYRLSTLMQHVRPLMRPPEQRAICALHFGREMTAENAAFEMMKLGVSPSSFSLLADAAISAEPFVQKLGLIVSPAMKFEADGDLLTSFLSYGSETAYQTTIGAERYDGVWPENTWFLGEPSLN